MNIEEGDRREIRAEKHLNDYLIGHIRASGSMVHALLSLSQSENDRFVFAGEPMLSLFRWKDVQTHQAHRLSLNAHKYLCKECSLKLPLLWLIQRRRIPRSRMICLSENANGD